MGTLSLAMLRDFVASKDPPPAGALDAARARSLAAAHRLGREHGAQGRWRMRSECIGIHFDAYRAGYLETRVKPRMGRPSAVEIGLRFANAGAGMGT